MQRRCLVYKNFYPKCCCALVTTILTYAVIVDCFAVRYNELGKSEFVELQNLIEHTIFTRKNDVNDA